MQATICKRFTFHACHQLPNHDGQCSRWHGHTYTLEVFAQGRVQILDGSSDEGMVLDFAEIKDAYKNVIEPLVEHQNLNETLPVLVTTAELIAAWMLMTFRMAIPEVYKVRVWETQSSYAEVTA